jgi:hypothetical protein
MVCESFIYKDKKKEKCGGKLEVILGLENDVDYDPNYQSLSIILHCTKCNKRHYGTTVVQDILTKLVEQL